MVMRPAVMVQIGLPVDGVGCLSSWDARCRRITRVRRRSRIEDVHHDALRKLAKELQSDPVQGVPNGLPCSAEAVPLGASGGICWRKASHVRLPRIERPMCGPQSAW